MNSQPDMPSWTSLAAFRAAAKTGSFRNAALTLGVTASAVSHQVRALEDRLGVSLFDRGVRHVRLTESGHRLATGLEQGFGQIEAALAEARSAQGRDSLRIATLPLFASIWLSPRIRCFDALFPQLSISIDTSARIADLAMGEADVAIRNVALPTTGMWVRKLLDLRATPLCVEPLAEDIHIPADLERHTLIGLNVGRIGWPDWLAAVGAGHVRPGRLLSFDSMTAAIEAAAEGRGIMLGLLPLVCDIPAAQQLVAPFAFAPQDAGNYYVVCRKQDRSDRTIRAFVDWLCTEVVADLPRLRQVERRFLRRD